MPLPRGYRSFAVCRRLQRTDFDGAAEALLTRRVHERAGLHIAADSPRAVPDAVVQLRLGPRALGVTAPCRVVYVVDEPDRRGFAYGTLAGHPECGEEAFVLTRTDDGRIDFTITAFSRHHSRTAKLSGPATRIVQKLITHRYLRALDSLGGAP